MILPAQKSDPLVALSGQMRRGDDAGIDVVDVDPAHLAVKIGQAQHDMGEVGAHQQGGQLVGHHRHVDRQGIRAAPGDELLRHFAGGRGLGPAQGQAVVPGAQSFLQSSNDLKHMGVGERGVGP